MPPLDSTQSTRDLSCWVDRELPPDSATVEWMLREAAGDPLSVIAEEHQPAEHAERQRVSRLRGLATGMYERSTTQ